MKKEFKDDGHTVYNMDGVGRRRREKSETDLTKRERRAAVKAAFSVYLPIFLGVLACFAAAMLLVKLWLG